MADTTRCRRVYPGGGNTCGKPEDNWQHQPHEHPDGSTRCENPYCCHDFTIEESARGDGAFFRRGLKLYAPMDIEEWANAGIVRKLRTDRFNCDLRLQSEAADAIESLQARVDELNLLIAGAESALGGGDVLPHDGDILAKRITAARRALNERADDGSVDGDANGGFVICYFDGERKWEVVSGEDAMQERVGDLQGQFGHFNGGDNLPLVFRMEHEIDKE